MQEQVHPGDGGGGQVLLLAVELAPQAFGVAVLLLHMLDSSQQHAPRTTRGVVDRFALFRIEHLDHQAHHATRGIELACLLVGRIGELLDQVLVGISQHVGGYVAVAQGQTREVFDQVFQQGVGEALLVAPLGIAEHAIEGVGVGSLDGTHGPLQG